jgi:Uma2 family endonuclease
MTAVRGFTSADLDTLPDLPGVRYEIIDGELFVSRAPSWRHQHVVMQLAVAIGRWDERHERGFVLPGPGLVFSEDNDVIPDLIWVSRRRLEESEDAAGHLTAAPELVIEVLSPGRLNEVRDRELKLQLYDRQGVQEYWIVDWEAQAIEVFARESGQLQMHGRLGRGDELVSGLLPGFSVYTDALWEQPAT